MASDNLPIPPHPMPSLENMLADARVAYGEAIGQMMDEVLAGFVLPDQKAAIVLDVAQFTAFLMCIKVVELRGQEPTRENLLAVWWPFQKALKDDVPGMLRLFAEERAG